MSIVMSGGNVTGAREYKSCDYRNTAVMLAATAKISDDSRFPYSKQRMAAGENV